MASLVEDYLHILALDLVGHLVVVFLVLPPLLLPVHDLALDLVLLVPIPV